MTAPKMFREPERKLVRLPDLDDDRIPGWRFTRHVVAWTLGVFIVLCIIAIVVASVLTMKVTVSADGVLEPAAIWPVRSTESGLLTTILVQTGDSVDAGQIVARLDSMEAWAAVADLESQLRKIRIERDRAMRSAPIDVQRAQSGVTSAEAHVLRARTLLRQRMVDFMISGDPDSIATTVDGRVHVGLDVPSADLMTAQSELGAARAQLAATGLSEFDVASNTNELDRLERLLAKSRIRAARQVIRAPASGVVLTEQLELLRGRAVIAGESLFEIADTRQWRATLNVGERDVYRVHVGDTVDIEIPAFAAMADNHVRGRVEAVGWQASAPGQSNGATGGTVAGLYRVVVRIDSRERSSPIIDVGLRRGYAVHGEIITRSERALTLLVEHFRDRSRQLTR
ncbi:efflux RND transporter periplasmic adaptor subunit [Gemmatimonas aurantiaca]|uniref:HlyD family secretion protein n=1 Tax=Gemmatimonas aurantiaca TaxID=173480 RepID=UPI00301CAA3D